jgi:hypothetical protein
MRQRLVVVSACSRFEAVYQGIATARGVCLWCAYGSMSLQPAVTCGNLPFACRYALAQAFELPSQLLLLAGELFSLDECRLNR